MSIFVSCDSSKCLNWEANEHRFPLFQCFYFAGNAAAVSRYTSVPQHSGWKTLPQHTHASPTCCCVCAGCYGVDGESDSIMSSASENSTEPWFCDACKNGVTPSCELCPNQDGIFKETDAGR